MRLKSYESTDRVKEEKRFRHRLMWLGNELDISADALQTDSDPEGPVK